MIQPCKQNTVLTTENSVVTTMVRGGGAGGRGRGGRRQQAVPDEIRATLVDHVVNHGFTMAEAGRRVQPNVPHSTVSSIIPTFRRENRYVLSQLWNYWW